MVFSTGYTPYEDVLRTTFVSECDGSERSFLFSFAVHPNVKLFISHGGISGVYEAVDAGVPVLGFPVFYDQRRNLASLVDAGMGVLMDLETVTEDTFSRAIFELVDDDKSVHITIVLLMRTFTRVYEFALFFSPRHVSFVDTRKMLNSPPNGSKTVRCHWNERLIIGRGTSSVTKARLI